MIYWSTVNNLSTVGRKEVEKARKKKMKYEFSEYVMVSKTYRMPGIAGQAEGMRVFVNAEEEYFAQVTMGSY